MVDLDDYIIVPDLIYEVEKRPAIWDRSLPEYRNKIVVHNAWVDLCTTMADNYEELNEKNKDEMIKYATKKWTNIRDLWTKYYKITLDNPQLKKTKRSYVHFEKCMFLKKVHGLGRSEAGESPNEDVAMNGSSLAESNPSKRKLRDRSSIGKFQASSKSSTRSQKDSVTNTESEVYLRCRRHISFFKGILPAIAHLNENDTLQFQIGVLNVIKYLRRGQVKPDPSITNVFTPSREGNPSKRLKREESVESLGSSFNGEEEYLSEEFLDY